MKNEIKEVEVNTNVPMSAESVQAQVTLIQEVMSAVMKNNQHYGVIAGCGNKPTLLKSGAEKLAMTFKLRPVMNNISDIIITNMENGHRDYNVYCHILNENGQELATGIGSCSTLESKYRYRNVSDYEITGENIPANYKEQKTDYRKQGYGAKNIDGKWEWVKYTSSGKTENPDIADVYNTVLKMAKKRAFIDGILSATAASDIFTQDIEDTSQENTAVKTETKKAKPSMPKPVSNNDNSVIGINKRFIEVKTGKKTCAIEIDGNYYMCNINNPDTIEIMKNTVGQEVEIKYAISEFKGTEYRYISTIVAVSNIDKSDPSFND